LPPRRFSGLIDGAEVVEEEGLMTTRMLVLSVGLLLAGCPKGGVPKDKVRNEGKTLFSHAGRANRALTDCRAALAPGAQPVDPANDPCEAAAKMIKEVCLAADDLSKMAGDKGFNCDTWMENE
jgi:hypothetical protein